MKIDIPSHLSDDDLVAAVKSLARSEREATASLIAHLAELDGRRLYLGAGFSSLFTYCCTVLHLSEPAAYNRIEAARAARRFPVILRMLGEGSLRLATVRLLSSHLTPDNHPKLLTAATGKSKRQVEELLVRYFPQPAIPSSIHRLPAIRPLPASTRAAAGVPVAASAGSADVTRRSWRRRLPWFPRYHPCHRHQRVDRSSSRSRQTGMKSGSSRAPRHGRSYAWRRTCSDTPSRPETWQRSSIGR